LTAVTTGHVTDEAEWSQPGGSVNTAVLSLVRQQRQTRAVALFGNATTRLQRDLAALGLDTEFDAVFNSSVVDALGCRPTECIFIDDTAGHVVAARALGFRAHHVQTATDLADFLAGAAA
jgi:putative hydrolase of the HAD superfamily